MFGKKTFIACFVVLHLTLFCSYAEILDVSLRIRNDKSDEKILNLQNLVAIKEFIIKNGSRETYSQMYNNNPAYHSSQFSFYLNPDTGQANINCELDKSDFQTLAIHDPNNKNQYCYVEFIDKNEIKVKVPRPTQDLRVSQIHDFASEAIQEILAQIKKDTPASKPQSRLSLDTRKFNDAINIAAEAMNKEPQVYAAEYVLMSVQQIIVNNKWICRVTFKPKELLPVDPSKNFIGLGGEAFVNVDLSTKKTVITYGE